MGFASHTPQAGVTSIDSVTSVTQILPANYDRRGFSIYNESTAILYIKFGPDASSSDYTVPLVASAFYEAPYTYSGIVTGVWASVNGSAKVTEVL